MNSCHHMLDYVNPACSRRDVVIFMLLIYYAFDYLKGIYRMFKNKMLKLFWGIFVTECWKVRILLLESSKFLYQKRSLTNTWWLILLPMFAVHFTPTSVWVPAPTISCDPSIGVSVQGTNKFSASCEWRTQMQILTSELCFIFVI